MITFKWGIDRSVVHGIFYLLGMVEVGSLLLSEKEQTSLRIAIRSRNWSQAGGNRSMVITLTNKFDQDWFVKRMHQALEKIEVMGNEKIEVVDSETETSDTEIEATN